MTGDSAASLEKPYWMSAHMNADIHKLWVFPMYCTKMAVREFLKVTQGLLQISQDVKKWKFKAGSKAIFRFMILVSVIPVCKLAVWDHIEEACARTSQRNVLSLLFTRIHFVKELRMIRGDTKNYINLRSTRWQLLAPPRFKIPIHTLPFNMERDYKFLDLNKRLVESAWSHCVYSESPPPPPSEKPLPRNLTAGLRLLDSPWVTDRAASSTWKWNRRAVM